MDVRAETRGRVVVAVGVIATATAAVVLPTPVFLIFAWVVSIAGSIALAGYWYERSHHYYGKYTWAAADAAKAKSDLERTNARLAEEMDKNQLLLDDAADAPVPFTIDPGVLAQLPKQPLRLIVPDQRTSPDAS